MRPTSALNQAEGPRAGARHRKPKPRTTAVAHWARTGSIPLGAQAEVAAYRARVAEWHREQEQAQAQPHTRGGR